MHTPVDALAPDILENGVTIGDAARRLEVLITDAIRWRGAHGAAGIPDEVLLDGLNEWFNRAFVELGAIFKSAAFAARFRVSDTVPPLSPARARFQAIHASATLALLEAHGELLRERARLASLIEELSRRVADHQELVRLIRSTETYSEAVWEKVVVDPIISPPLSALINNGITQAAVWDALKLVFAIVTLSP